MSLARDRAAAEAALDPSVLLLSFPDFLIDNPLSRRLEKDPPTPNSCLD